VRHRAFLYLVVALGACTAPGTTDDPSVGMGRDRRSFDAVDRGRYLAIVGDCAACHTMPGGRPHAGGRAIETPFGKLLASNLTPDRETGIGALSDAEFIDAMRNGRGHGGKHLYPAMPYVYYTKVTGEDLLAIRAFLETMQPVRNEVISNQLPFPFDIRAVMVAWNAAFFTPGIFKPVAGKSDEWNAGAYLVEGLGHCGACHTAKNLIGGDRASGTLQGGELEGWFAPNLTRDTRIGLGSWSADDVVIYLKTGHNRISAATGTMSEVVALSTSQMTEADLRAMAIYLKDQPAPTDEPPRRVAPDVGAMRAGAAIYVDNCAACHASDGAGVAHLFPALAGSPSVQSANSADPIRIVLQGAQSVATAGAPTGPSMPALGWKLSDEQVAAVITYIGNSWGNSSAGVSASDVRSARRRLSSAVP
jgi:mono/diheme cytochrome c family protein